MALLLRPIPAPPESTDSSVRSGPGEDRDSEADAPLVPSRTAVDGVAASPRPVASTAKLLAHLGSGVRRAAVGAWNVLAGDDLRTIGDAHASPARRALAAGDLALNVVPEGKALELGAKLAARAASRVSETGAGHALGRAVRASPLFREFEAEHLKTATGARHNADVARPGYQPPWQADGAVHDGRLLHDDHETFARVYREVQGEQGTAPMGQWLLRRSDILGKSPKQIKDAYALPHEPTHVVEIHLEAGFRLRVGPSGPNAFGRGGEEQIQTITKLRRSHLGPSRSLP